MYVFKIEEIIEMKQYLILRNEHLKLFRESIL